MSALRVGTPSRIAASDAMLLWGVHAPTVAEGRCSEADVRSAKIAGTIMAG